MSKSSNPSKSLSSRGILILILVLVVIAACVIQVLRPYPAVGVNASSSSVTLPGSLSVTFPEQGESAVGTDNFGVVAHSENQAPIPIASVAKIMTAYLVLEAYPLEIGEDGPSLTMTAQDYIEYQNAVAEGHSVLQIAEGVSLTERQLLEGLMLPSGNNIAIKLGRWVSGSDAAFVEKMNATAQSLGMTDTHYADASGVSASTVSTAVDQVKIAQAAMKNPVFREVVAMPQATLPVAGTVYNVNSMLGKHGVVGIKTGSTSRAGGNFVSASPISAGGETHYLIAVVLGQQSYRSLQTAMDENVKILDQVRSSFKMYSVTPSNSVFGQITSPWDSKSDLTTTQPVQVFGYPGLEVPYSIKVTNTELPLAANQTVATLEVQTDKGLKTAPLQNTQEITEPDLLWRLFRY